LSFSGRQLNDLPDLCRALGLVKVAAAEANEQAEVIEPAVAGAIVEAARQMADGDNRDAMVADPLAGGGAIAVHVNVNEVLANLANLALGEPLGCYRPVHPARSVGASQSTADVVHTAGRLAVLDATERLVDTVTALLDALERTAARAEGLPALARTCLQDALAVEARLLFDGSAAAIRRRRGALVAATDALTDVTLGSTVVGTGDGAPDAYRAAVVPILGGLVGRTLTASATPASVLQHGDDLVAVSHANVQLAAVAAKIARDLRLLSSGPAGGFGELRLPAVMEGSSFFVGKVNPAVPETVVQAAILVDGHHRMVESASAQAELHLHPYDLTTVVAVLDESTVLDRALGALAAHTLEGISFNEDRSRALADQATPTKGRP